MPKPTITGVDTSLIAAIYYAAGVKTLLTTNARDFGTFDCFELIDFTDGEDQSAHSRVL